MRSNVLAGTLGVLSCLHTRLHASILVHIHARTHTQTHTHTHTHTQSPSLSLSSPLPPLSPPAPLAPTLALTVTLLTHTHVSRRIPPFPSPHLPSARFHTGSRSDRETTAVDLVSPCRDLPPPAPPPPLPPLPSRPCWRGSVTRLRHCSYTCPGGPYGSIASGSLSPRMAGRWDSWTPARHSR